MKASELVKELQALIDEGYDVDVVIPRDKSCSFMMGRDVMGVSYGVEGGERKAIMDGEVLSYHTPLRRTIMIY